MKFRATALAKQEKSSSVSLISQTLDVTLINIKYLKTSIVGFICCTDSMSFSKSKRDSQILSTVSLH